jgi:hypothetical protein
VEEEEEEEEASEPHQKPALATIGSAFLSQMVDGTPQKEALPDVVTNILQSQPESPEPVVVPALDLPRVFESSADEPISPVVSSGSASARLSTIVRPLIPGRAMSSQRSQAQPGRRPGLPQHHVSFLDGSERVQRQAPKLGALVEGPDVVKSWFLAAEKNEERDESIATAGHTPQDVILTAQAEEISQMGAPRVAFSSLLSMAHVNSAIRKTAVPEAPTRTPTKPALAHPSVVTVRFV